MKMIPDDALRHSSFILLHSSQILREKHNPRRNRRDEAREKDVQEEEDLVFFLKLGLSRVSRKNGGASQEEGEDLMWCSWRFFFCCISWCE
jgi:hypothetical protein